MPDAPLWPSTWRNKNRGQKTLAHGTIYQTIKDLAKKAGIAKHIYPHLFRHSRATSLAGKLTEAQMKEYFGWVQSSEMAATYVHLSGRDVDNALLKLHGLASPENEGQISQNLACLEIIQFPIQQEDKMKVRVCQRCKEHNSPIAKYCIRCGIPMDGEFLEKIEGEREKGNNLMNKLMEDDEVKEFLLKKMMEKCLNSQSKQGR